jgi:hypothetical protein
VRSALGAAAALVASACSVSAVIGIGAEMGAGGKENVTATGAATGGSGGFFSVTSTSGGAGGLGGASSTNGGAGTADDGGDVGGSAGAGGAGAGGSGPVLRPSGIAVVGMRLTSEIHPGMGDPHADPCTTPDEVLIGFDGTMDVGFNVCGRMGDCWLQSVTGHCGKLALVGSGPFTVAITAAENLPVRGGPGNRPLAPAICPQNQMIVGFTGRSSAYIDRLSFYCAPINVVGDSSNGYTASVGSTTLVGPLGGNGGTAFGDVFCNQGEVAVGTNLHAGAWIDGFGLDCGAVTLVGMRP